jgi:hypothetical protein
LARKPYGFRAFLFYALHQGIAQLCDDAELIGASAAEIILTSGATEAHNLAIKGAARFAASQGDPRRRIITVASEHKCVLGSVRDLAQEGFEPVITDHLQKFGRRGSPKKSIGKKEVRR